MDVRYINPFIRSIENLFTTMVGLDVQFGKPCLSTDRRDRPDVSGVIGFSGDAVGSVALCFSKAVARRMASAFSGLGQQAENPDFADAIGELANIVAGGAKAEFEDLNIEVSLPLVVIGDDHEVCPLIAYPRLVVPCVTALGPFTVSVSMQLKKKTPDDPPTEQATPRWERWTPTTSAAT